MNAKKKNMINNDYKWLHVNSLPGGTVVKNLTANERDARGAGSISGLGSRKWQPTAVFLP